MDFENNGQSVNNFIHKVKKQAKRLFQVSKNNNNSLEIKNLSQAQELLAQINGYPDWHALERNITKSQNILQKTNEATIKLTRYEYHKLFYLKTDNLISTFFRLSSINENKNNIQSLINDFLKTFDFQLNMKIHNVSLVIEQKTNKFEKENNYSLYDISKSFNLTEEEAKKLFLIDKSSTKPYYDNELSIYILVTTENKYEDEHMNLCLLMNQVIPELESLPYLNKNQLDRFELKNGINDNKITKNIFLKNQDNLIKWIYIINILKEKKVNYVCKYSFIDKEFIYKIDDYEINKSLIDGLINGIKNTENYPKQNFIYNGKPIDSYYKNKENSGLSLKSKMNNNIINYNSMTNSRSINVDLVYGQPGAGKSVLTNMITLGSVLDKELKDIPKIAIIDIGCSYKGVLDVIKNILPEENKNIVKYINYGKINDINSININPFDLNFGQKSYEQNDIERLMPLLLCLFNNPTEEFKYFLNDILKLMNDFNEKLYVKNVNLDIDKKLNELNFKYHNKVTWFNIVDFLFINKEILLAQKAQTYASIVLGDLLYMTNNYISHYSNAHKYMVEVFNDAIKNIINLYPKLNMPTNIVFEKEKIIVIDLYELNFNTYKLSDKMITSYIYLSILSFTKTKFLNNNQFYYKHNFPENWKNDWTDYINENKIEELYYYYHFSNKSINMSKLVIDEYHRCEDLPHIRNSIITTLREARKDNMAITLCSQSLSSFDNHIISFSSGLFISKIEKKDEPILLNAGFNQSEINFMKEMKFLDWAMKIITNNGRYFDIVKLELNEYLQFALSYTVEDMYIKEQLQNKMPYLMMLDKSVEYLQKHKSISFRKIAEIVNIDKVLKDIIK